MWAKLREAIDLEPPTPFHDSTYLGCTQQNVDIPYKVIADHAQNFGHLIIANTNTTASETNVKVIDPGDAPLSEAHASPRHSAANAPPKTKNKKILKKLKTTKSLKK